MPDCMSEAEEILMNFFSFSILAPLESSKLEEVHQDFESEKGGKADLRNSKNSGEFFSFSILALLESPNSQEPCRIRTNTESWQSTWRNPSST